MRVKMKWKMKQSVIFIACVCACVCVRACASPSANPVSRHCFRLLISGWKKSRGWWMRRWWLRWIRRFWISRTCWRKQACRVSSSPPTLRSLSLFLTLSRLLSFFQTLFALSVTGGDDADEFAGTGPEAAAERDCIWISALKMLQLLFRHEISVDDLFWLPRDFGALEVFIRISFSWWWWAGNVYNMTMDDTEDVPTAFLLTLNIVL